MTRWCACVLAHDDADRGDVVGGAGDRAGGNARLDVMVRRARQVSRDQCGHSAPGVVGRGAIVGALRQHDP